VGFLDDLKRQADALRQQQSGDAAALARNVALTEAACRSVMSYFNVLIPQLNVLQPVSPATFRLDRQHAFEGLRLSEFRLDSRLKPGREGDVFDYIVVHWQLKSGESLQISKDFLPEMDKLESRLQQSGATVDNEAVRNPDNGKLIERRYSFLADFVGSVRLTPDHDQARVHLLAQNLDDFESVSVDFPAIAIGSAKLDELARWIVGHPHRVLEDGQNLRRHEA
jgi:hypothetical protein